MATIKLPFEELLAYMGATHHWPMTGDDPLNQEVLDGPGSDLSVSVSSYQTSTHPQDAELFNYEPDRYMRYDTAYSSQYTRLGGIGSHLTNQNLTDWSVLCFVAPTGGTNRTAMDETIDSTDMSFLVAPGYPPGQLIAMTCDHANQTIRSYKGKSVQASAAGTSVGSINLLEYHQVIGHIAFFPKRLTSADLGQILDQRLFTGTIEGTATVDGSGAPATIRAITRAGGRLSGETTAASDGAYKLWVTDPTEMDILAIPPDGVAARPLAHGPILPVSAN